MFNLLQRSDIIYYSANATHPRQALGKNPAAMRMKSPIPLMTWGAPVGGATTTMTTALLCMTLQPLGLLVAKLREFD
jgi:hypothetical protein